MKRNFFNLFWSLLALALLYWAIALGLGAAKASSQSTLVLYNAQSIKKGLEFFYNDYDRFPTTGEFLDNLTMLPYFSLFPPAAFSGGVCNQSFVYKRPTQRNYELNYCLPRPFEGHKAGWNKIIGNEVAE